jgi:peptidoglycan hydrolase-like protein with peptidoglycan-binding domain
MGGRTWGSHPSCPGSRVVAQLAEIVRRAKTLAGGKAPSDDEPRTYTPPKFPTGLAPNTAKPSAKTLQRALKAAGYLPRNVTEADNYGPQTQAAVVKFHNAHPQYRAANVTRDPAIGPKGWAALFRLAYGK